MNGLIFQDTLRHHWKQILYWGIGIGLLGFYAAAIAQDSNVVEGYAEVMESMPPILLQAFGLEDTAMIGTPIGFISFAAFTYGAIVLAVFAVTAGLGITANEEDEGVMDVFLALPISRTQVVIEKYLGYTVIAVGIILVLFLSLILGISATGMDISISRLFELCLNLLPSMLLIMAFTAMVAGLIRRKAIATAVAGTFVLASYFIDMIGSAASDTFAESLSALSFFSYIDSNTVSQEGLNIGNMVILLVLAVVLLAGAVVFFNRRDVGA